MPSGVYERKAEYKYKGLVCRNCGIVFDSKTRNKNQKTCGKDCGSVILARKGEDSKFWKGDDASYSAKHLWLIRNHGKAKQCEHCGSEKNVDWANKTGKYLRDMSDWKQLCRSCHIIFDTGLKAEKI